MTLLDTTAVGITLVKVRQSNDRRYLLALFLNDLPKARSCFIFIAGQPVNTKGKKNGIHGPTLNDSVRQYHQGVLALDESIGKLVGTLEATGQLENTLIVFTSDQGFAWGQHGFRHKMAALDCSDHR